MISILLKIYSLLGTLATAYNSLLHDHSTLKTTLRHIERKLDTMDTNIKALQDKVNADNELIRGNLSNVAADIANLNQKIQDLIANGSLQADDLAALKEIGDITSGMVTDTANLAAIVPDPATARKPTTP